MPLVYRKNSDTAALISAVEGSGGNLDTLTILPATTLRKRRRRQLASVQRADGAALASGTPDCGSVPVERGRGAFGAPRIRRKRPFGKRETCRFDRSSTPEPDRRTTGAMPSKPTFINRRSNSRSRR
jgi:hypothetical protein